MDLDLNLELRNIQRLFLYTAYNSRRMSPLEQFTNKEFLLKRQAEHYDIFTDADLLMSVDQGQGLSRVFASHFPVNLKPENRVNISTLKTKPGYTWGGKYFLCRTIAPIFKTESVQAVVDDPEGEHAVFVHLYNYTNEMRNLDKLMPVGTILALKNPFFKPTIADGGYGVREGDPENVIVISPDVWKENFHGLEFKEEIPEKYRHLQSPTVYKTQAEGQLDEWMKSANENFAAKRYKEALRDYSKAIEIAPQNVDLICQKVKSLRGLKNYGEAVRFFSEWCSANSQLKTKECDILLDKLTQMDRQQKTGEYNLFELFENPKKYNNDLADFLGPVKIAEFPGKRRGLVVTDNIPAGKLLIACKAFAIDYQEIGKHYKKKGRFDMLVEKIVEKLTIEPELREDFYNLSAGPRFRLKDAKHLSTVHNLSAGSKFKFEEAMSSSIIHKDRIEGICSYNALVVPASQSAEFEGVQFAATGIWILPSHISHSCMDYNCSRIIRGDFMIIRASKDIPNGTELTIPYVAASLSYKARTSLLEKYRVVCHCSLCDFERIERKIIREQREDLLEEIKAVEKESTEFDELLSQLENMRISNPKLNIPFVNILHENTNYLLQIGKFEEAVQTLKKIRSILTEADGMKDSAIECTIQLFAACKQLGDNVEALKWAEIAKKESLTYYGFEKMIKIIDEKAFSLMIDSGVKFE